MKKVFKFITAILIPIFFVALGFFLLNKSGTYKHPNLIRIIGILNILLMGFILIANLYGLRKRLNQKNESKNN